VIPGLYLADTSATVVARDHPDLARWLVELLEAGLLATCVPLDLEAGFSATSPVDHQLIAAQRRELLIELPDSPEVAARAREIQAALAATGKHRAVSSFEVLVAAYALTYQATVVHHDRDYDLIAAVTNLATERVPWPTESPPRPVTGRPTGAA
jgi:hypothetical protein